MEQVPNAISKSSELYQLAKQITQTENNEEKDNLFEKLSEMVHKIFKNEKLDEIDNALSIACEKDENDIVDMILDDAEVEVSHIEFEQNSKKVSSSMFLLSCAMITAQKEVVIPSIKKFQDVMQKYLLELKVIKHADEFRLGAVRIDNDTLEDLEMNDWWKIHRNILSDLESKDLEEKLNFENSVEVQSGVSMFHMVPIIICGEDDDALDNFFALNGQEDIWDKIGKELSDEKVGFNIIAPNLVSEGISESQYILQSSQLQLMLQHYQEYDNIDLGYVETDEEGTYVVLVLDNEDNTLADFYVFETYGNEAEFVNMLVNEAQLQNSQKIWHFDASVNLKDLEAWHEDEPVYLDKLMKHAHEVDFRQYQQFVQGSSSQYLH